MLEDKTTTLQILGSLMKKPSFLSQSDKYQLNLSEFTSHFEKVIFASIYNLYQNGLKQIQIIDIENYLENDKNALTIYQRNNGLQYLQDLEELANENNFDYYYNRFKKICLLRDYQKIGIDISDFYEEDLTNPRAFDTNSKFENLSVQEISEAIKRKILKVEHQYLKNDVSEVQKASEGIEDLVEGFKNREEIGLPLQGFFTNEIMGGARKGTLCIRSLSSGCGKTRTSVGDACKLAFPLHYDWKSYEWIKEGNSEKVLFIATEQDFNEIRKMILAYLTDINESRFRYGDFSEREEKIIRQAIQVMKEYEDNFFIVRMPNPTIELIKHTIRENCLLNEIEYVFYDYIFIGPALLGEFRVASLRNDELLLLVATALKDLAVELNIFIMTSTQVNANVDDNRNIRNEASLAGGRSTINKADFGFIGARPTKEELEVLEPITSTYGVPNLVFDVFKVRSGQWTQVRIWACNDLGTLKRKELFLTDAQLNPIKDFTAQFNYLVQELDEEEQQRVENLRNELQTNN